MSHSSHDSAPSGPNRTGALANSRLRDFIALQALFWLGFLVIRAFSAARLFPDIFWHYMTPRLAIVAAYAALTTLIHLIVIRFTTWSPFQRLMLTLALCALSTIPMHAFEVSLAQAWVPTWPSARFLDYFSQFGWVLLAWAGYHFAQDHAHEVKRQASALATAQIRAHEAQMKMLRYQLNPHFLFNSLNAISTLVLENRNKDAEGMILRLSRFLRHTIDTDPTQLARLGDEALVQRLYLEVEAVRFGDKMQVLCTVPETLHDCLVPTLLLQPVIENAIKHGVSKAADSARIAITAAEQDGRLKLTVENEGPPFKEGAGGVGLRNTGERLQAIYGDGASVTVAPREQGGARVEFDLPLLRS